MKKRVSRFIFGSLVFGLASQLPLAYAERDSGGGQGVVCRNDDGTVASAKLLDLVEAVDYFLVQPQAEPADRPYLEIAHEYASILDGSMPSTFPASQESEQDGNLPARISHEVNAGMLLSKGAKATFIHDLVDQIDAEKMLIPGDDFKIPPIGDSHPRILPSRKGCSIEQIAIYTDGNDKVHFVGGVWNKLDNINRAALLIHESLYKSLRPMGDTTSDQTRTTVAFLFSGMKFEWILNGVPQKYLSCWTNDANTSFQFIVYPSDGNSVTAQFLVYDGEVMLTKTVAKINGAPFAGAFGLPAQNPGNIRIMDTISNPLLDRPNYEFSIEVNSTTGTMNSSIEAVSSIAGKNPLKIQCKDHLSEIFYGADGSVGVGPAQ